jgi:tetratricopeptide (TPR) repeat protein
MTGCGLFSSGNRGPDYTADVPLAVKSLRMRVLEDMAVVIEGEADSNLNDQVKAAVQAELGRAGLFIVHGREAALDVDVRIELRVSETMNYLRGHVGLVAEANGVAVAVAGSGQLLRSGSEFPLAASQQAVSALLRSPALAEFAEKKHPKATAKANADARENPETVARAKSHFAQGTRQYELKHFQEALVEFEAAYLAVPDPVFLYNSAQCHRRMGHDREALDFYRSYLRNAPEAPNRTEVTKRIQELEGKQK